MSNKVSQPDNSILQIAKNTPVDSVGCRDILDTMQIIAEQISLPDKTSGYSSQRLVLRDLFIKTSGSEYSKQNIMLRLSALDTLYSTNASKSYFAIEDMVEKIWNIPGNDKEEENANHFFMDVANGLAEASNGVNVDEWFNERFGIQKNCRSGHRMMSLLSKYAYYCCLLIKGNKDGFPIYDSLALASFPFVFKVLWPSTKSEKLKSIVKAITSDSNSEKTIPMSLYVQAMNTLCDGLGLNKPKIPIKMQKYDIMDAYLWRMGKFSNGNLSLIVNKRSYIEIMNQLSLNVQENDYSYFESLAKDIPKFQACLDCSIKDIIINTPRQYPTIFNNDICKKKTLKSPDENSKKKETYKGDINALTLYSLMTNTQFEFELSDKKTERYINSLYKHWNQYFNH